MANIKANLKSKRQSDKRNKINKIYLNKLKKQIKQTKVKKEQINKLYSMADSLANKHIIHKNKANRIKSRNAKFLNRQKNENKK